MEITKEDFEKVYEIMENYYLVTIENIISITGLFREKVEEIYFNYEYYKEIFKEF